MACYNSELPIGPPGPTGPQGPPGIFLNELVGATTTVSNIVGALSVSSYVNGYFKRYTQSGTQQVYTFIYTFQAGLLNSGTYDELSFTLTFPTLTNLQLQQYITQFCSVSSFPLSTSNYCDIGNFLINQTNPGELEFFLMVKPVLGNYRFQTQFDFILT
jgi:hypothetical protein